MHKVVWFARSREGMTNEEGRRYWSEDHASIALRTGIERYVQNHVIGPVPAISGVRAQKTHFDGYSIGCWRDADACALTMSTPEWDDLAADGPNVFDPDFLGRMSAALCEHVVGSLPGGASPDFEGFSECWFHDRERFVSAVESDAWAEAVRDGESFLDFSRLWGAVLSERVVRPGGPEVMPG